MAEVELQVINGRFWLAAAVLTAIFSIVYLPALGHGFVKDDYGWIAASRVQSAADAARLFTSNIGFYRPLVSATFAIDHAIWGLNPRGYGATNVLLLLADALLLFQLARRFALPAPAALLAVAVWAFNFHGVNMAVLWISGRTTLLMCLFALAATHAFLGGFRLAAGALVLGAMLCKEEAVMLPAFFAAFDLLERRRGLRSWPMWAALGVYAVLRIHSGAFGPFDAPVWYRFVFTPAALLKNVAQYIDRAATWPAVVAAAVTLAVTRRSPISEAERRAIRLGALWFGALYAITVFLPLRSSLYAVAPSLGSAMMSGALAARAWRDDPQRVHRVATALIVVVALLVPVYRSRNHGLVEPADLAARSLDTIQDMVRGGSHSAGTIILVDDAREDVTLGDAFGTLFPEAIHLFAGADWKGEIVSASERGKVSAGDTLVFELHDGVITRAPAREYVEDPVR